MATLDEWTREVCVALGVDPVAMDQQLVLDLARDVAHGVARPAAPLTAYLVGVAVGRGARLDQASATLRELLREHPGSGGSRPEPSGRDDPVAGEA